MELQDISLKEYSELTDGFTGADLAALIKNALIKVVHQMMEERKNKKESDKKQKEEVKLVLCKEMLDLIFHEMKKTINIFEKERLIRMYEEFEGKQPINIKNQKTTLF